MNCKLIIDIQSNLIKNYIDYWEMIIFNKGYMNPNKSGIFLEFNHVEYRYVLDRGLKIDKNYNEEKL